MKESFELQLPDLLFFIKESCHGSLHETLLDLSELFDEVEFYGKKDPSFPEELIGFVQEFISNLQMHLLIEEKNLFPMIEAGVTQARLTPLAHLEEEHNQMKENLLSLRKITHNYQLSEDSNMKCLKFYRSLKEMDRIILNHIQIENHILFPMVRSFS